MIFESIFRKKNLKVLRVQRLCGVWVPGASAEAAKPKQKKRKEKEKGLASVFISEKEKSESKK